MLATGYKVTGTTLLPFVFFLTTLLPLAVRGDLYGGKNEKWDDLGKNPPGIFGATNAVDMTGNCAGQDSGHLSGALASEKFWLMVHSCTTSYSKDTLDRRTKNSRGPCSPTASTGKQCSLGTYHRLTSGRDQAAILDILTVTPAPLP